MVTWTDADGRFAVAGLRPGDYVAVAQDRHGDCIRHTTVVADGVTDVAFLLGGSVALRGTVQRRSGEPVRGVMVTLLDERGNEIARQWTEERGEVSLYGPARAVHVQAHRGEQLLGEQMLVPPFANPQTFVLVVDEPLAVRGTLVAADGSALVGWHLAGTSAAGRVDAITDEHGAFTCWGVFGEMVRLEIGTGRAEAGLEHRLFTTEVARGSDDVRLVVPADRMPTGSATVRVVDSQQQPMPGTSAVLVSPLRVQFQPTGPQAAGIFRFEGVPPGTHNLEIYAPGHAAVRVPVTVCSDAPTDLGEIRLERAAPLRVRPCREDGTPWPVAPPWPTLRDSRGARLELYASAHRDGDALIFDTMPPGRYLIVANGEDGMLAAPLAVELRADQETRVDWPTSVGLSVYCTFTPPAGREIAADETLQVAVRHADGRTVALYNEPWLTGDHWTLSQTFALGDYELSAQSSRGERWHTTLHVLDLQHDSTQVEVPLQR